MRHKIYFWILIFVLNLTAVLTFPAGHAWVTASAGPSDADGTGQDWEHPPDSSDKDTAETQGNDSGDMDASLPYGYIFTKQNISARAGEKIRLKLCTIDLAGSRMPAADVKIQIYDKNKCLIDKKAITDPEGTAVLTFETAGTYYAGALRNEKIAEPELCRINIKKASIEFVNKKETLKICTGTNEGISKTLKVKVNGKLVDASRLTWRVGNKKTVSLKNGIITAKKEGKTVIYASIYHATAKCRITVLDRRKFIVIDPGHQAHQDAAMEPVGPGAKELKMKVSSGTAGKYSGSEYKLNLTVSKKLKNALLKKNYRVLMTRTTNSVNISNKKRAEIANEAGADAFIRIHANSSTSASTSGIMTICPTKSSPYCQDIYKKSRKLSDSILKHMKHESGTIQGCIWETDTMTGINWCRIPVTIVELGFQSNPAEDKKLASDSYQDRLVCGIALGLDEYFHIRP